MFIILFCLKEHSNNSKSFSVVTEENSISSFRFFFLTHSPSDIDIERKKGEERNKFSYHYYFLLFF